MRPGADQLMALCEATWPPARSFASGAFLLRDGAGGGKRVSAATLLPGASWSEDDRLRAEQEMRALGQQPLFQIRAGEERLDATLEAAGEQVKGAVLASDGFFPFDDTVRLAASHGITAVIHPGGSMRDADSIKACDELGLTMLLTCRRHFLH